MALHVRAVVPVLVLVVLAGCSGGAPGTGTSANDATTTETTVSTATPGTQPTTTSTATTGTGSGDGDGPPGVANGTVTDAFALTDAHVDAVGNQSHTVVERTSLTASNGTTFLNASTTVAVDSDPDVYLVESTQVGTAVVDRETSLYANGSIVARHPADNASYAIVHTPQGDPATPASWYPGVPRNVDTVALLLESSDSTSATRVGADTYRITASGATMDAVDVEGVALDSASNVTLDLYATGEGRILNYTVSFDATRNGSTLAGGRQVRYEAVGSTTVETPSWFVANETTSRVRPNAAAPGRPAYAELP